MIRKANEYTPRRIAVPRCQVQVEPAPRGRLSSRPFFQGDSDEARSLWERALVLLRRSLGEGHHHTKVVLKWLETLDLLETMGKQKVSAYRLGES